jgi:hypothetical protein
MLAIVTSPAFAHNIPDFVKPKHRNILGDYLSHHSYNLASDTACFCDNDLIRLRETDPKFQPYYAVGDINDDGIEDFAVGLIGKSPPDSTEPKLTVVVFHGPFSDKRKSLGIELFKDYAIEKPQQVISVFKVKFENGLRLPARLDFGPAPFGSDDHLIYLYDWKKKKYREQYFYH